MRYPKFLTNTDTIAFVAPAFGCSIEPYKSAFNNGIERLKTLGHPIKLGPNCYVGEGIGISNKPELCAKEFMDMWCEDESAALFSCGGGELMCEILPYLDYEKIKKAEPKWFMGYSDNTNLGLLLAPICDTAWVYGPNGPAFGMEPWHCSVQDAYDLVRGTKLTMESYDGWQLESLKTEEEPLVPYNITEQPSIRTVNMGEAFSGRLLGGCMDIVANLIGTRFDKVNEFVDRYAEDGIIWFLEACDLNLMSIRRALWSMEQAGYFRHVKGFIIGRPLHYGEEAFGLDRYSAVTSVLEKFGVPIVLDMDLGHLPPTMPLVNGAMATVAQVGEKVQVQMKFV